MAMIAVLTRRFAKERIDIVPHEMMAHMLQNVGRGPAFANERVGHPARHRRKEGGAATSGIDPHVVAKTGSIRQEIAQQSCRQTRRRKKERPFGARL
jgi:hypothetical protein